MTTQPTDPAIPMPQYADGTWTHVMEAQRSGTVEQIVVHNGVPMGPRGLMGPTGPTGAKGESTEWIVGRGDPPDPNLGEHEIGEIYLDLETGDVYVLGILGWRQFGNILGPTGPTGDTGAPANMEIGVVLPGGPGEAAAWLTGDPPDYVLSFIVPAGPTGPTGPRPLLTEGVVTMAPIGTPPDVEFHGSNGVYIIDYALPQGPTGPAGTNIKIIGELQPPGTIGPPSYPGTNPGDGVIDGNDDVWMWNGTEWINVGQVVGPTGPQGPTGPGFRHVVWDLILTVDPVDPSKSFQDFLIADSMGPYPLVRVLLEEPPGSGMYSAPHSVYLQYYTENLVDNKVRVVIDTPITPVPGKVVLS